MSCAMEYQQLVSPSVPIAPHQNHHSQQSQQQQQQQPQPPPPPPPLPQQQQQHHHHQQHQSQQQSIATTVPSSHPHIVLASIHPPQQTPPNLPPPTTPHAHQIHPPLPSIHDDSTSSRWTQYQHIWRQHHVYMNGKQTKDGPEDKKDTDGELWGNVEAQSAFLGPNLWDKTLPYDADLKYVDLDEFLSENGIPVDGVGGQGPMQSSQLHKINNNSNEATSHQGPASLHLEPVTKRERSPSPSDCCSPDTLNPPSPADSTLSMASSGRDFDPRTRAFSDEELKPQPMIKKSRKQFVPDDLKDDKYWARRRKNNMAAKRSRDARRMKENQIALRAGFLEKENMGLRQELDRLKNENMLLRDKLMKIYCT
ncbi:thyrotroph embryonic factor-like isoform X2 [Aphidius gifuensis]|uniref:thyrotroph embryonic factor-like isoform X2 n=1 Tax=Aphidius gifuensis TaxID=684658 RepID=UPI001CDC993D|nr:thyrotroph embryonic factor-like isoform X2 [Aphidius gifuensis]